LTKQVLALKVPPGIQRDGTLLDAPSYVDGSWVRFQRGRPRKIGGYNAVFQNATGVSRGMIMSAYNNVNYVYSGYSAGLQYWSTSNQGGVGSGPYSITMTGFTSSTNNLWQFDIGYDSNGGGATTIVAHPAQDLSDISSTTNSPVLYGTFPGGALSPVGQFTASVALTNGSTAGVITGVNALVYPGQLVTGTGIPTGTTVTQSVVTGGNTDVTLSLAYTGTTGTQTLTFDNQINVSGGCCIIYPYLFVYGNNGLIQNSSAGNFQNWVGADANANNVATGKIVKGLPVRGGTTSPSGLFWSLDSLIRVSYTPQTVGTSTTYWRYDQISTQSSLLSSNSIIEYDGLFYWCGTDRFLMYNGVVQEVPNTQNMNYFFDNLNYAQRQKVWVSKVPRWGEIWWFYPKGNATECTDAIIYNVREKVWYDAGQALGARRSAGTFTEVFRFPIWSGNDVDTSGNTILWQHETGVDQIYQNTQTAIDSYFETNNLGWVTGGPNMSKQTMQGQNNWMGIERVEPDFIQTGTMNLYVTGRSYADDSDVVAGPFPFDPTTLKIDLREQRREPRLRFESNTVGGDYQMGSVLISAEIRDVRGTGNP
jgi:hypothetical protein